jgi:hypothetical protein
MNGRVRDLVWGPYGSAWPEACFLILGCHCSGQGFRLFAPYSFAWLATIAIPTDRFNPAELTAPETEVLSAAAAADWADFTATAKKPTLP